MPHTASRYQQDLGFTDGFLFLSPTEAHVSGTSPVTRNAVGDWSNNQAASVTVTYAFNLANAVVFRTGFGEDLQEQFGGTGISASAGFQGRPDTIAAMAAAQQLTPRTANKLKGIKLLSYSPVYLIGGAALTTHTTRVDKSVFANGVAIASSVILASGANGLATAVAATPYVTEVSIPTQIYQVSDLSQHWIEVAATTQVAGTYRMYGVRVKVEFNFN